MKKKARKRQPKVNHLTMPLRPIVKREKQNGQWFVILACHHASPGIPKSRLSRFYPCPTCADEVKLLKREVEAASEGSEDAMTRFRRELRRKLKGGTF